MTKAEVEFFLSIDDYGIGKDKLGKYIVMDSGCGCCTSSWSLTKEELLQLLGDIMNYCYDEREKIKNGEYEPKE